MCKLYPFNSQMEDKSVILHKNCSKLLELAATDDLPGFIYEVEERGCDVDEDSFWYSRSFGSKKMGFEERTPLMIASLYGSTKVLKYILGTRKVDVNRACGSDGATPLHCAAAGGSWLSIEVVKLLIDASGDINAVDSNGKTPGDVIAPHVKSSNNSTKKTLEMAKALNEKKDYAMDISLPDINVGIYGSDEFRMYSFKVKPCSRAYTHDWTECPFVHPGENARRRDPTKCQYTCVPCPEFKKVGSCGKGDSCEYAHSVFESWLHPAQYRTRLCKDETGCSRKVCFFAHKTEELRPLYASTGSGMPSPKAVSTSPMSPALHLSGSRLKMALSARDLEFDRELLGLERIRTQQQRQFVEEMASLSMSSPYGDVKPTNLDDVFGSLSHLHSPTRIHVRQNTNQLRASYPSSFSSSPSRNYGFDSSAAAAIMNSRSTGFAKRSQSFIQRNELSGPIQSKLSGWGSPNGKLDWGFNGEEANKFRKSASFGSRSGNAAMSAPNVNEPDVSWVNSLVKDVSTGVSRRPQWIDQMYIEQEQMVA